MPARVRTTSPERAGPGNLMGDSAWALSRVARWAEVHGPSKLALRIIERCLWRSVGTAPATIDGRVTPNLCPPHWPRPRYGQIPVGSLLDEHAPRVRARWWTVDSRHYQAGQARYFARYRAPGSGFVVGVMRRNGRASLRSRRATRWTTGSRSVARDVMARRRLGETVTTAGSARTRVRPAGDGGRVRA